MLNDGSLTLNETEINMKVTEHFQNIARPNNLQIAILPSWQDNYELMPTIDENCYNS